MVPSAHHLYINSEQWYQWHVPSTFATVNTHANVFFIFLPGGMISKEWCHIVLANCYFEGETGPIVPMFTGLSGNTWQTAKIAHEGHNDVSRLCWRHLRSAGRTWPAKASYRMYIPWYSRVAASTCIKISSPQRQLLCYTVFKTGTFYICTENFSRVNKRSKKNVTKRKDWDWQTVVKGGDWVLE